MFEFLVATGKVGVIGIGIVFIVVFLLAEPGKEISFWGIKFHKKYRKIFPMYWRRIPRNLPENWKFVLLAFAKLDDHHVNESALFEETRQLGGLSELETRSVCAEMKKYGLVKHSANYISLQEKALPLANKLMANSENRQKNG
jgi:hypothetical protein